MRILILDIQSGLVRGALVERDKNGQERVLASVTESISEVLAPTEGQRLMKKILKLVSGIVEHLHMISPVERIASVHYILSSPWISSSLKTIKADYESETDITKGLVDSIITGETKKLASSADAVLIEQNIFEIRLNGYEVSSYLNKSAHSLQISLGNSWGSRSFLDKLHDTVEKLVHIKYHTCHSALFMQYSALRTLLESTREYVYVHVHSELTDIVIVKNGLCRHISSFPFGTSTLVRKVAHAMKQGAPTSNSLLTLYGSDKLSEKEKKTAKKVIDPLLSAWSAMCMKSLTGSFDIINIPRTVFMCTHSHFELFKESMLLQNDMNLNITPYESATGMEMYMLAIRSMIQ